MKRNYLLIILIVLALFIFTGCEKKTRLIENKDYYIIRGKYICSEDKKRGYYIYTSDQPNPQYYLICMGAQSTGGYSLNIKEVNKINEKTEVIVEEIEPKEGSIVSDAFTYPSIAIEFSEYQKDIIIKNTNGEEFNYLKD